MLTLYAVASSARQMYPCSSAASARTLSTKRTAFISNNHCKRGKETYVVSKRRLSSLSAKESEEEIKQKTTKWINNVVIGLNMCPFAEKTRSQKQLFTTVVRGDDVEEIISVVLYESILRKDDAGTTVVICPELFNDNFLDFYDIVVMAEDVLHDQDMEGIIQIAAFHPLFEFAGSGKDGVDNLTNRSPYPIFHILREEEVSLAVDKLGGDSGKVWKRNISLLEAMEETYGREKTETIMSGENENVGGLKDLLRSVRLDEDSK